MPTQADIRRKQADINERVRAVAERLGLHRPVTVRNAAELTPDERRRYGFADDWTPVERADPDRCKIVGCDKPRVVRGMCRSHYHRAYRQRTGAR